MYPHPFLPSGGEDQKGGKREGETGENRFNKEQESKN
jgi:hypothetical protein